MKKTNKLITVLIFIFLYIPMIVLILGSFNTGKSLSNFEGFTLRQYGELFRDKDLLGLLGNSLLISVISTAVATAFGTFAAVGIHSLKPKMRKAVMSLTNIPMTNPDIVTGISLSLLFVFIGTGMLGQKQSLNFWTLLIAHITFNLPYVILNVMPKLQQMNPALKDAAMDLGCTPLHSFFKVTIHEIMPGIVSGAIMAFTMSLDDFVISYFVTGSDFVTLPVKIYSFTRKPIHPKVYAMFTLLFLLIFVLMVTMNLLQLRSDKRKAKQRVKAESRKMRIFKRVAAIVCVAIVLAGTLFLFITTRQDKLVLNVMNWGQNIADGSDDTMDIIAEFEKRYPNIQVNYTEYASNEELYSKLSNGGLVVDVIIPSDYMIARMINENMLLPLDFSNIPNYKNVSETYKNQAYDPENKYSVPYTWGTVGIIYNSQYVDEADVTGWDLLWNEKYAKKILMFDNSRDAFGIAAYKLGIPVNTTDKAELQRCADELAKQQPLVQQYVMDQVYDKMIEGNAWIAPYYAGDAMMMMEENPDLRFYLPENQNFNLFIDAMCIPNCSLEKEAAELFINFMCDPEISGANMDYICYGSPIDGATDYMEDYLAESEVIYPPDLSRGESYGFLPEDITRYVENLFMKVRTDAHAQSTDDTTPSPWEEALPVVVIFLGIGLSGSILYARRKRKK